MRSMKISLNINIFIEIELKICCPIKTTYQINQIGKKLAGTRGTIPHGEITDKIQ